MSTRRSARAKAPVKYTSDSEGSEFGVKKSRVSKTKTTPKKVTKRKAEPLVAEATPPHSKRSKKDPETLAMELREKAERQEDKVHKQKGKEAWESWLGSNSTSGQLLDSEPNRQDSITQTDCQKKYGLKKEELGSLLHYEKPNPLYGGTMKLFLEEDVKKLAFRKYGLLAGFSDDEEILKKGEEIWTDKHGVNVDTKSSPAKKKDGQKTSKAKTPKRKWTDYVSSHSLSQNDKLSEEPKEAINQTDSKTKYGLKPDDLVVLPYFPKKNPAYGNTTKLFKESEVKVLAYRKAAVHGGLDDEGDEVVLLGKGKELFEKEHAS